MISDEFTFLAHMGQDLKILPMGVEKLGRIMKKFVDKPLEVSISIHRKQRTIQQNRWLWGVAYITIQAFLKDTTGESLSKEAIHSHTLQHILGYSMEYETIDGKEVLVMQGKGTSNLNTVEFMHLKDELQGYWAERGCEILDPRGSNLLSEYLGDD